MAAALINKQRASESSAPIASYSLDGVTEYDDAIRGQGDANNNAAYVDDDEYDLVNSLKPAARGKGVAAEAETAAATRRVVEAREVEVAEAAVGDADTETGAAKPKAAAAPKAKRRRLTLAEDPQQFHARPRELALINHSEIRGDESKALGASTTADYIFSQIPFSELQLHSKLVGALTRPMDENGLNLGKSTVVQSCVLPLFTRPASATAADGTLHTSAQNVLLKSETGSGKTLAFVLPILHSLMSAAEPVKREDGTRAIIISPTRELCTQISNVLTKLTSVCVNIVSGCMTGGEKKKSEKARLRKGVVILVSTPGRLLDHMKTTDCFNLQQLRFIVLDEADRLLDLGFEKTIMEVVGLIRGVAVAGGTASAASGQSLEKKYAAQQAMAAKKCLYPKALVHIMASATLTLSLRRLALPLMGNQPFNLVDADKQKMRVVRSAKDLEKDEEDSRGEGANVGDADANAKTTAEGAKSGTMMAEAEMLDAPKQLQQYFMTVSCKWRLAALLSFLRTHSNQKIMVFMATCDSVDFHSLALREAAWPVQLDAEAAGGGAGDDNVDSGAPSASKEEEAKSKRRTQVLEPLKSNHEGVLGEGFPVFRLHGNIPQKERATVFTQFAAAPRGVLLCTDVAARGLDLPKLDWILQYDPPCETTDYVHRCGRTARRGKAGSSLLFLLPSESAYTTLLANHGLRTEALSLQKLFNDVTKFIPGATQFKNTEEMAAVIIQRRLERTIEANQPLLLASRQAFRSHVRAYATHSKDSKGIFRVTSLHLGHVARSFALRDAPKAGSMSSSAEDVLARIHNGVYGLKKDGPVHSLSREDKKRARDEKYSLSGNSKSSKDKGKKRQRTELLDAAIRSTDDKDGSLSIKDRKKEKNKRKWDNAQTLQKLRPITSGGAARNRPSASNTNARPRIGGHAQRQRALASAEFQG